MVKVESCAFLTATITFIAGDGLPQKSTLD
jgi:hypothetical protein